MKLFNSIFNSGKGSRPAPTAPAPARITSSPPAANLSPRKVAPSPGSGGPPQIFIPPSLAVIKRLAEDGGPPITDSELDELRKLQVEYDRARSFLLDHIAKTPKQLFAEQQASIAQRVLAGEGDEVAAEEVSSTEDIAADQQIRRKALKGACRAVASQAQPIAERVAARLAERAARAADEIEKAERSTAEAWGVDYSPSRLIKVLRSVAAHPRELLPPAGSQSPKQALVFAGITI